MKGVLPVLHRYVCFSGRASRREYWRFVGVTHAFVLVLLLPAWLAFLEIARRMLEDAAVLDAIASMLGNPMQAGVIAENDVWPSVTLFLYEACGSFPSQYPVAAVMAALAAVCILLLIAPMFACTVRRLRDAGRSPWWVLSVPLACVPETFCNVIGGILSLALLVLCLQPTKRAAPPCVSSAEGRKSP